MSTAELHRENSAPSTVEAPHPIVSKYANDIIVGPLLQEYIADLPNVLAELCDAARGDDQKKTCHLSHRLKGDSATYGYPELSHVAHELEQQTKDGKAPDPAHLARIIAALQVIGKRICDGYTPMGDAPQ